MTLIKLDTDGMFKFARAFFDRCLSVIEEKSKDYHGNSDALYNFKIAGEIKGESPEKALWGMAAKHLASVRCIVEKIDRGEEVSQAYANEKLGDMINYLVLLRALIYMRE